MDIWSVDDGERVELLDGSPIDVPNLNGGGDRAGIVFARGAERRFEPHEGEGLRRHIARVEGGFPHADLAPKIANVLAF